MNTAAAPKRIKEVEISTVHDAITEGKLRYRKEAGVNWTFRCEPKKKALVTELLKNQGVDPSAVFQGFVDCLLKDYMGEKAWKKFEAEGLA